MLLREVSLLNMDGRKAINCRSCVENDPFALPCTYHRLARGT